MGVVKLEGVKDFGYRESIPDDISGKGKITTGIRTS